jgi:TNF receptor-associated factor 4
MLFHKLFFLSIIIVFAMLCKGEYDPVLLWPFNHKISVTLLDQNEDIEKRNHLTYIIKPNACKENMAFLGRPVGERNAAFGAQKFVELDTLATNHYTDGDTIYLKVEVDTVDMFFV